MIAIGVAAVAGFGGVSGAAAKPRSVLKFAPAKPAARTPIRVSLKAPNLERSRGYYGAELSVDSAYSPVSCISDSPIVALRSARRGTFTGTLDPRIAKDREMRRWCNGPAHLEVRRYTVDGRHSPVLARRTIPVGTGKADPAPTVEDAGVPVKITVLGGSTLTASASGRPDRSAQLTGILRGKIPARFKPNTDVGVEQISGSLTPLASGLAQAVFPPDPLCPDATPPATFDAVPASSSMLLKAAGDATFALTLNGAPSQLFGCGPAGPLSGATTLPLSGRIVGPNGLLALGVAGNVGDVALPNGSQGGLAASLVLNVDLSGKG
jgi:hypothetical protein